MYVFNGCLLEWTDTLLSTGRRGRSMGNCVARVRYEVNEWRKCMYVIG